MGKGLRTYDQAVLFARIARGYIRAKASPGAFGPFPILLGNVRLRIRGKAAFGARLMVEAHTWAVAITVAEGARLTVGDGVFINGGTSIEAWHDVRIGKHVLMAPFVSIIDDDRHEVVPGAPLQKGPTVIGDGVWLGRNVAVLPGVTIGAGSVIGANSVVSKDIPANSSQAVEPDLLLLAEPGASLDVDLDLHPVLEPEQVRELRDRSAEALVAQHDRLDVEREVPQRPDRLPMPFERRGHDPARGFRSAVVDRLDGGIEHQRDPGEVLHGAVVQEEGEPPALVLLGGDDPLDEALALVVRDRARSRPWPPFAPARQSRAPRKADVARGAPAGGPYLRTVPPAYAPRATPQEREQAHTRPNR